MAATVVVAVVEVAVVAVEVVVVVVSSGRQPLRQVSTAPKQSPILSTLLLKFANRESSALVLASSPLEGQGDSLSLSLYI